MLLRLPRKIFDSLPAAALIGSLLSLGNLAVHRELIVMRASGISSAQLLGAVGLAGFGLAVVMALLGESLAPSLERLRERDAHARAAGDGRGHERAGDLAARRRSDPEPASPGRRLGLRRRRAAVRAWVPITCSSRSRARTPPNIDAENRWVLVELLRDVVPRERRRYAQRARSDADLHAESESARVGRARGHARYAGAAALHPLSQGQLARFAPLRDRVLDAAVEHRVGRC